MYKLKLFSINLNVILIFIFGCPFDKNPVSDDDKLKIKTIYNQTWKFEKMVNLNGDLILIPESNWIYSIYFQQNDSLNVVEACNKGKGFISLSGNNSVQIQVSCTEMACSVPTPNYLGYGDDLNSATSIDIHENRLRIYFTNRSGEKLILIHYK